MRRAVLQPVSDATSVLGANLVMNRDVRVLSAFVTELLQWYGGLELHCSISYPAFHRLGLPS